jgi:hypothetical protein
VITINDCFGRPVRLTDERLAKDEATKLVLQQAELLCVEWTA